MKVKKIESMETNNFEQQSRERFEERELQPSDGAWGKLEQMLNEAQPQKKKSSFPWFAIAASFVGIAIIATVFYNQNKTVENDFVEQDSTSEILKNESLSIDNTIENSLENSLFKNKIIAETDTFEEDKAEKILSSTKVNNQKQNTSTTLLSGGKSTNQLNHNYNKNEKLANNNNPKLAQNKTANEAMAIVKPQERKEQVLRISDGKVTTSIAQLEKEITNDLDAVTAQINELKNNNQNVAETDIDALLLNAQNQLQTTKILNSKKVDAMALLGDVEMDIRRSFRNKVFYALEEGYDYVRATIVTRND